MLKMAFSNRCYVMLALNLLEHLVPPFYNQTLFDLFSEGPILLFMY